MTPKEIARIALHNYRGDDLERAQAAFQCFSPKRMDEEWGQSGRTCQEILDGYQVHVDEVEAALRWLDRCPE